jgi:hypothetical protein
VYVDDVEDEVDLTSADAVDFFAVLCLHESHDFLLALQSNDSVLESFDSELSGCDSVGRYSLDYDSSLLSSDHSSVRCDLHVVSADDYSSLGWDLEVLEGVDVLLLLQLDDSQVSHLDVVVVSDVVEFALHQIGEVVAVARRILEDYDWFLGLLADLDNTSMSLNLFLNSSGVGLSKLDSLDSNSHLSLDDSSFGSLVSSESCLEDNNLI